MNEEKMTQMLVPESLVDTISEFISNYNASVDSGLGIAVRLPHLGDEPAIAFYDIDEGEWVIAYCKN